MICTIVEMTRGVTLTSTYLGRQHSIAVDLMALVLHQETSTSTSIIQQPVVRDSPNHPRYLCRPAHDARAAAACQGMGK